MAHEPQKSYYYMLRYSAAMKREGEKDVYGATLNVQRATCNAQRATLNVQRSTSTHAMCNCQHQLMSLVLQIR